MKDKAILMFFKAFVSEVELIFNTLKSTIPNIPFLIFVKVVKGQNSIKYP